MKSLHHVTHLTTSTLGGAGVAAMRLHQRLVQQNISSQLFYRIGDATATNAVRRPVSGGLIARVAEKISDWSVHRRTRSGGFFTLPTNPNRIDFNQLLGQEGASILHLHWISRWINYSTFFSSASRALPIVWSLHDMNPLTGGCHLPGECRGFVKTCESCPQFKALPWDRRSATRNLQIKENTFRDHDIHVVANSRWMMQAAQDSRLGRLAKSVRMIHLGVDTEAFQPRGREKSRELLGVPANRFVIAFGAADLNDGNKNLRLLCDAISASPHRDQFHLLLFGKGWPAFPLPVPCTAAGWTDNERLLSLIYSAADVLAMPSNFESFGLTAVEAMSCGTPVIASRTGGLTDIVSDGDNGLLVAPGDAVGLREAIDQIFRDQEFREALGQQARTSAMERFSIDRMTSEYIALYDELRGVSAP